MSWTDDMPTAGERAGRQARQLSAAMAQVEVTLRDYRDRLTDEWLGSYQSWRAQWLKFLATTTAQASVRLVVSGPELLRRVEQYQAEFDELEADLAAQLVS